MMNIQIRATKMSTYQAIWVLYHGNRSIVFLDSKIWDILLDCSKYLIDLQFFKEAIKNLRNQKHEIILLRLHETRNALQLPVFFFSFFFSFSRFLEL